MYNIPKNKLKCFVKSKATNKKCSGNLIYIQYDLFYCDKCNQDYFYNRDENILEFCLGKENHTKV